MDKNGKVHKIVDKELATGTSPMNTAKSFINKWSTALDVDANEFIERGPFLDGHNTQELMYNKDTGEYKFTAVYFHTIC